MSALQARLSDSGKSLSARLLGSHCQDVGWAGFTRMAQQIPLSKETPNPMLTWQPAWSVKAQGLA